MAAPPPAASIIAPTFREGANIKPFVERVFRALGSAAVEAELIIVDDDSRDGTEQIVQSLGERYPVRLIVRKDARGLSSAVLAGFQEARFDRFVVLDADLQHPPETIPALLAQLDRNGCDFAIATRYGEGGDIADDWPTGRRLASWLASISARPLMPLTDPMSGFFAIHRRTWEGTATLNPIGYKIALELFVKGCCCHPKEVPIHFATRAAGASKFSFAQQRQYVRHLAGLYRFRFPVLFWAFWTVLVLGVALLATLAAR